MQSKRTRLLVLLPFAGLVLLVPPVFLFVRWILVFNRVTTSQADRVTEFWSIFPAALRDAQLITWLTILFSAGAVVTGLFGSMRLPGALGWLSIAQFFVGGLLTLWLMFTLM